MTLRWVWVEGKRHATLAALHNQWSYRSALCEWRFTGWHDPAPGDDVCAFCEAAAPYAEVLAALTSEQPPR